jgi:hypothetical protein
MSSDNAIFIQQWEGEWFVWHGSLSADYYEPASFDHGFPTEREALDFADDWLQEIGYVEGGIIQIGKEEIENALISHISYLTERLKHLRLNSKE